MKLIWLNEQSTWRGFSSCILLALILIGLLQVGALAEGETSIDSDKRAGIAVMEFKDNCNRDITLGACDALRERIAESISKSGKFRVFERMKLDQLLQEQGLQVSGLVDPSTAVRIGKLTGVRQVVCGSITNATYVVDPFYNYAIGCNEYTTTVNVQVDYTLIDAQTGEDISKQSIRGSYSGDGRCDTFDTQEPLLREALYKTANKFAETLNIKACGKVVKINDSGIFVNLGSMDGISVKTLFEIAIKENPIKDPDTGNVIGWEKVRTIQLRPVQSSIQSHLSLAVPGKWIQSGFLGLSGWTWKEDESAMPLITEGLEVTTIASEH